LNDKNYVIIKPFNIIIKKMSDTNNKTVMRMFALVAFFILLFGGAAVYAAYQAKALKVELEQTEKALEECRQEK
jgi:hypothetical protein